MARGQEKSIVGGQIDPYVQTSMQQNKQQAENRLVTAMQQSGATQRTAMQERGAGERASLQAQTQREGMAAQAESDDKRAAEAEIGRREDLEYRKTNDNANRVLRKGIADQDITFRKAEMAQDLTSAEQAINLQLDLATIETAHRIREGEATRNMLTSMAKMGKEREEKKQKLITLATNAKNKTDQGKNLHSLLVTNVGKRLQDDPQMRLDPTEKIGTEKKLQDLKRVNPLEAVQKQITMEQSKIVIEDLLPENIHKLVKQMSEGDVTAMDIRSTWGVIEGSISIFDDRVTDAEDAGNNEDANYWKWQRLRLNNIKVALQGLMNNKTSITAQKGVTVGSMARDGLGIILGLDTGSEVNKLIEEGGSLNDMPDLMSGAAEPYPPFNITGLRTKAGQGYLDNINQLFIDAGGVE